MVDKTSRTSGRINIEVNLRELYEQLTRGTDPEQVPFRTMKDVFMLAACIGFMRDQFRPLSGTKHQPFHYSVFSEQVDIPILKAIAIMNTGNIEVLTDMDAVAAIAEGYANYGIHEIKAHIIDSEGSPLWNLVEAVR